MTPDLALYIVAAVAVACLVLMVLLRPSGAAPLAEFEQRLRDDTERLRAQLHDLGGALRQEIARGTSEGLAAAFDRVQAGTLAQAQELSRFGEAQRLRLEQMDGAAASSHAAVRKLLEDQRETQSTRLQAAMDGFGIRLREEQEQLRALVGAKLEEMRAANEAKLEDMRRAVDEKLQAALEKQVGESFKRVAEQFSEVQKSIGEVAAVASQVGDLKRLFSNVKSRGGWGEAQLGAILEDVLHAGAFERNLKLGRDGGGEVVEFALRVPTKSETEIWLAIDAKFPIEDYDRLLQAGEAGARDDEATARRALGARIRTEAGRICSKYIQPPRTVEFAILYLPSDSLFAEVARVPGLIQGVRHEHNVVIMGPSLLPAFLHTIRVGHATLTLESKAVEIQRLLGAVRTEWDKMDLSLDSLAKRADLLSKGIDDTVKRNRIARRALSSVDRLESASADALLGLDAPSLALEMEIE